MNKIKIIFIILLLFQKSLFAEFENKIISARQISLGGAYTALADDISTISKNPGGIAQLKEREFGVSYSQLYSLDELNHNFFVVAQPLNHVGTVAFAYETFGYSKYLETKYSYNFSRRIAKNHFVGVNFNWFSSHIENTTDQSGSSMDFGIVSYLGKKLKLGFSAKNVASIKANEYLDQQYNLGFALFPDKRSSISIDFKFEQYLDNRKPITFSIGHEIKLNGNFAIRAGFQQFPVRLSAGFGAKIRKWLIDYSYRTHSQLDGTHNISMSIKL